MVLQGPDRGYQHHRVGGEAGHAAFDVQELLCAQVGAEAGLSDGVVPKIQGHPGGHHRVAAVGDIGKGAAVDEGGSALQGLDQVGLQGVLQQGGHGPGGLQITGGLCDVRDVPHLGALGDLNISFHLYHVSFSVSGALSIKKERNGVDSVRPDGRHKGGGSARYTPCGRSTSVSRIAFDRS